MNTYNKVSINIIALFAIAILLSFIPEFAHGFFGDWFCKGAIYVPSTENMGGHLTGCAYNSGLTHDITDQHAPSWHWGYRHWLYLSMGICLAIVHVIRIGFIINNGYSSAEKK